MVHAGTHVDLDDPRVQVLVDHEVVTHHFEETLLPSNRPLATLDAPHYDALHLLLDGPPSFLTDKLHKSLHFPHTLVNDCILVVLLDGVVGEVHELVIDIIEGVVVAAKPEVALLVEPDDGWVEVLNQHPLSDVELTTVDEEGVLDVLLDHELAVLPQAVVGNVVQVVQALYAPSAGEDFLRGYVQLGLAIHTLRKPLIYSWGSSALSFSSMRVSSLW